jgi:metal-dependent amidase/aminoacylase/carboxypeptidase family protein
VQRTEVVLRAAFGPTLVKRVPPITASEDFSAYLNEGVPGMFFFIGVNNMQDLVDAMKPGGKPLPFNHSPFFAPVPEPSIKLGVQALSRAALNLLAKP